MQMKKPSGLNRRAEEVVMATAQKLVAGYDPLTCFCWADRITSPGVLKTAPNIPAANPPTMFCIVVHSLGITCSRASKLVKRQHPRDEWVPSWSILLQYIFAQGKEFQLEEIEKQKRWGEYRREGAKKWMIGKVKKGELSE
jgi:hypothetical protein